MDGDWEDGLNLDLKRMNISEAAMSISKGLTATNPFEIDLVVEKVMDYLTYDALRTCFSVSWGWRKKAFLEIKSRESIRTIGPTAKKLEKLYLEIRRKKKAGKAVKLIKLNLDRLPLSTPLLHETLKLLSPYLDSLIIRTTVKLHELFTTLRELPNLSELSILTDPKSFDLTEIEVGQLTYPIQDPITSRPMNFENIRSLSFYSSKTVPSSDGPIVKFYLKLSDALKIFPNLGTLHVGNLSVEDHRNFNGISFAKLKNLRLAHNFELDIKSINKSLGMLAKLDLKLSRLQFQLTPLKGLDRDLFRKFVESQRDTLQHLDIVQAMYSTDAMADHTPNICPFPLNLPHLKTLHVQKPFIQKLTPIFNALPSLEEAKICVPKGFNWKDTTTKVKKSYPNLQVLRVDYMHPSLFGIMSQYFPSLRVLQINLCVSNVNQRVFSSMKTPAEDDSESVSNRYPCNICGLVNTSTSNATCGSCGQKRLILDYPDYSVVDADEITSKALGHWKEINTLIAGKSAICFLENRLKDHNNPYLPYLEADVEIETLGFHGMAQWATWEANEFDHRSHYLRPSNWTFTTCSTVDGLYVPFDNHPHLERDDPLRLFRNIFF